MRFNMLPFVYFVSATVCMLCSAVVRKSPSNTGSDYHTDISMVRAASAPID